jgi:hypothetical protein
MLLHGIVQKETLKETQLQLKKPLRRMLVIIADKNQLVYQLVQMNASMIELSKLLMPKEQFMDLKLLRLTQMLLVNFKI